MTDSKPRLRPTAATTDPAEPVTVADIAAFTARLARLRPPALGGDPAEYAALLAHKAELFARIADQHARTDPVRAHEAREIAERAHAAARHAANTHDTTNVNDLASPSPPGWGISLSNSAEFRRAPSIEAASASSAPCLATRHAVTTTERSTPYRSAASRWVACPVTTDIHNSYFSLGDSRRRGFLPDTVEADIINSLQVGATHRPMAGYFEPDLLHEVRRKTGAVQSGSSRGWKSG